MSSRRSRSNARPHGTSPRILAAGIAVALLIAAAGGAFWWRSGDDDPAPGAAGPVPGYIEGVAGSWQRINPVFANTNQVDADLSSLVFSGLVRIGPDGRVEPDLAQALPEISDDGRSYTFQLRPNLTWQDGAPLTSKDVAFTIGRLTDPEFKGDPALAEPWLGVTLETPDNQTIVLHLGQPSAPFLARNATIGILPEHLLGSLNSGALFDAPFNTAPIGSGPYRLLSIDTREAVLEANPSYHLGAPKIEVVRLRFYSDYPSAIRAVVAGELQGLLMQEPLTEAQQTELSKVKGIALDHRQRASYTILYLNNDQAAFFEDSHVRRALSLALDRQAIVDAALPKSATPSSSAVAPGTWAYSSQYDHIAPNIAAARKLLDAAGWKILPASGVLTREGQEFRFTIRTDNDPVRVAIAGEVARQLEALGIRATVASTTFSVLRRDFLQSRTYEAAVVGWDQGPDPDPYFGWHSSQLGANGLNLANFQDIVTDELIAKARTTPDDVVREDLYRQFQEKWDELAPSIVIAYPEYVYIHSKQIQGMESGVLFSPAQRFHDIQMWTK